MGSLERAMLTGFICRLCSEMHKVVTHIYGEAGRAMRLSEKINKYLPVNVSHNNVFAMTVLFLIIPFRFVQVSHSDPLPKTICDTCLSRLESQHKLVSQIELVKQKMSKPPTKSKYSEKKKKRRN